MTKPASYREISRTSHVLAYIATTSCGLVCWIIRKTERLPSHMNLTATSFGSELLTQSMLARPINLAALLWRAEESLDQRLEARTKALTPGERCIVGLIPQRRL